MKAKYTRPTIRIAKVEIDAELLKASLPIVKDDEHNDWGDANERDEFEDFDEPEITYGNLWKF
jgi:hypothetical protein